LPTLQFRIGSRRNGYVYTAIGGMEHGGCPMYECARGRDMGFGKLYLYLDGATWTAVHIEIDGRVAEKKDIVDCGTPAFRSATPGSDVRLPGEHSWICYGNATAWWPPTSFVTETWGDEIQDSDAILSLSGCNPSPSVVVDHLMQITLWTRPTDNLDDLMQITDQ
jgi:hypothetical protein